MRIVLVDDDEGMVSVWKRWLAPLEAELLVASTVEAAIEHMRIMPPPDIVLLDLILPPFGAADTVSAIIKLREFNPALVVIVISGMDRKGLLDAIANARVDGFIHKDELLTQASLLRSVQSALKGASSSGDLLDRVGAIVKSLTELEERKKTARLSAA